jgi:hypothetical protein
MLAFWRCHSESSFPGRRAPCIVPRKRGIASRAHLAASLHSWVSRNIEVLRPEEPDSVEQRALTPLFSVAAGVAMFMTLGGPPGPSPLRMTVLRERF